VVVPRAILDELRAHAREEAPNECCGLLLLRDGVAERYVRGVNKLASPYRYELFIDPAVWADLNDEEDLEQAIFHSHPETAPRPSRTDRENVGLWSDRPYFIYGLALDDLRAWHVTRDEAVELEVQIS
jgi:[CysO sulfur-carrier protein]-S-L-cysteine hydrolase